MGQYNHRGKSSGDWMVNGWWVASQNVLRWHMVQQRKLAQSCAFLSWAMSQQIGCKN
jgi:hypothetical protein